MLFIPQTPLRIFKHASYRQSVGTAGFAFAAADTCACFYGEGFIASFCPIGKPVAFEIACKKEHIRDADADGAGGAIVAAAAEIARQFGTDFCYLGIFIIGKGRSVGTGGGICLNFLCAVHAGDRDGYKLVCGKVTHCNASVFNCTARHGFHCDKADIPVSAFLQQGFALAFNNVIREHDRFNPVKLKRTFKTVSECAVMPICPILPASRAAKSASSAPPAPITVSSCSMLGLCT